MEIDSFSSSPYNSCEYFEDVDDDEENEAIRLPIIPKKTEVCKEKYASVIVSFLEAVTVVSERVSFYYFKCVSSKTPLKPVSYLRNLREEIGCFYDEILIYCLTHSANEGFVEIFECKNENEDISRKTSLRTHLFWELCRLRWCKIRLRYLTRVLSKEGKEEERKNYSYSAYVSELRRLGICLHPDRTPMQYTQRELGQAFFLLSSVWKTIDYSKTLSKYVNFLMDRLCCFFAYSMPAEEMDDVELRQSISMNALRQSMLDEAEGTCVRDPLESIDSLKKNKNKAEHPKNRGNRINDCSITGDESTGYKLDFSFSNGSSSSSSSNDDSTDNERKEIDKQSKIKIQYAPNLDYLVMSQMRFFNFLGDLTAYENVNKGDLITFNEKYAQKLSKLYGVYDINGTITHGGSNAYVKYDVSECVSIGILKRFVSESSLRVTPEMKERTASRYVYCSFSKTDYDWLYYKKPVSLPSFADEFISKACREGAYAEVVQKGQRSYPDILKQDADDVTVTGFYEWCMLKLLSRLFALNFDLCERYVFERDDLRKHAIYIFQSKKPLIVQFFSRYYVLYKGTLYVDKTLETIPHRYQTAESESEARVERNRQTLYDTFLLWIRIMLVDFPKSGKSIEILKTLKTKYAEYMRHVVASRIASGIKRTAGGMSKVYVKNNANFGSEYEDSMSRGPIAELEEKHDEEEDEEENETEKRAKETRSSYATVHDDYFKNIYVRPDNKEEEEYNRMRKNDQFVNVNIEKTTLGFF
jgi:hypothetical protein